MKKGTWVTIIIILVIIGVSYYAISGNTIKNPNDEFAKCLSEKAILYMQTGCYACQKQEELFGTSYKYLTKVNCTDNIAECSKQEITQTPTWIIDYKKYIGYKTLEQLSELSDCELKKENLQNGTA